MDYSARVLGADLTRRRVEIEDFSEKVLHKFIGGAGLAAKILWERTKGKTDAFSEDNPLVFMIGPLTGTGVPMSSRYTVASISPLTDGWGESHSGGRWGTKLSQAGFRGIVVRGRADQPVYLYLHDGEWEIRDAGHLWGKDTYEVSDLLQKETSEKASVLCIGPAGENQVRIACIMNDGLAGRAAARCGLGAVMGYKNLKAIVTDGSVRPAIFDVKGLKEQVQETMEALRGRKSGRDPLGIAKFVRYSQEIGNLPIRNWKGGRFESFVKNVETLFRPPKSYFCLYCPTSCSESHIGTRGREAVWEALAPLGSLCGVDDIRAIEKGYELCNRLGLDAISTGGVIAFAMELYEKGLISNTKAEEDLTWGNAEAVVSLVLKIGYRRGFGELLGEGVKRIAQNIGPQSEEFAMHVKGLEIPAHDPRAFASLGLAYATANRGACHLEAHSHPLERRVSAVEGGLGTCSPELGFRETMDRLSFANKERLVIQMQNLVANFNSLCLCNFLFTMYGVQPSTVISWLNSVTGWGVDLKEFLLTGERIFNLKRLFNLRRGIDKSQDTLPKRMLCGKRAEIGKNEIFPDLETMLPQYYQLRGWDAAGVPTLKKLRELGLEEFWAA